MTKPKLVTPTLFDQRLLETFGSHHTIIAEHCTLIPFKKCKKSDSNSFKRSIENINAFLTFVYLTTTVDAAIVRANTRSSNVQPGECFFHANDLKTFFANKYKSSIAQLVKDKVISVSLKANVNDQFENVENNKSTFIKLLVKPPKNYVRRLPIFEATLNKLIKLFKSKFENKLVFQRFEAGKNFEFSNALSGNKDEFNRIFKYNVPFDEWKAKETVEDKRDKAGYLKHIDRTFKAVNKWNSLPESYRLFTFHVDSFAGRTFSPLNTLPKFTRDYLFLNNAPWDANLVQIDFCQSQISILANEVQRYFGRNEFTTYIAHEDRKLYELYMLSHAGVSKSKAKSVLMKMLFGKKFKALPFFRQFNEPKKDVEAYINRLREADAPTVCPIPEYEERSKVNPKVKRSHFCYRLQKMEVDCMEFIIDFINENIPSFQYATVHDALIFDSKFVEIIEIAVDEMNKKFFKFCKMKVELKRMFAHCQSFLSYLPKSRVIDANWVPLLNVGNVNDISREFNYAETYVISDCGQIVNRQTARYLLPTKNKNGYLTVHLSNGNGTVSSFRLHRLVAANFCPGECEARQVVNHINEIKYHPHAENLEWVSHGENVRHSLKEKAKWIGYKGKAIKIVPSEYAERRKLKLDQLMYVINHKYGKYKGHYNVSQHQIEYELINIETGESKSFYTKKAIQTELSLQKSEVDKIVESHFVAFNGWYRKFPDRVSPDHEYINNKPSGLGTRKNIKRTKLSDEEFFQSI